MTSYLLDTSALLAHYRAERGGKTVQELFDGSVEGIFISSVTLTEFSRRLLDLGMRRDDIQKAVSVYEMLFKGILPVNREVALQAFDLTSRISGRLPPVDALIAATAQLQGAVLVHRDEHMRLISSGLLETIDLDGIDQEGK